MPRMSTTMLPPLPLTFIPEKQPQRELQKPLRVVSEYQPNGDQPTAIAQLVEGIGAQERDQVLLGVTGSGKTFTMAKIIEATQRPALVLAPNKTLAAQLYAEMKSFFPENAAVNSFRRCFSSTLMHEMAWVSVGRGVT